MLNPEIEEAKEETLREIIHLPKLNIKGEETEPYVIIDKVSGKIRIMINQKKKFRVLNDKDSSK